jgi:hypothetical protein
MLWGNRQGGRQTFSTMFEMSIEAWEGGNVLKGIPNVKLIRTKMASDGAIMSMTRTRDKEIFMVILEDVLQVWLWLDLCKPEPQWEPWRDDSFNRVKEESVPAHRLPRISMGQAASDE